MPRPAKKPAARRPMLIISFDLSGKDPLEIRQTPTGLTAWQALGDLEEVTLGEATVPAQRFKKDVIRLGQYVKLSDGLVFQVTPTTLGNWVLQFHKMRQNGVKVPIPDGHKNAGIASKNMGWVDKLWAEDGVLWMSCRIIGDDAIRIAKRNDVSLHSPPVFVDGKGNAYTRPIGHIALCPDPVVPGLGEFIPLAASLGLRLQGESNMLEYLQRIGALLGLDPAAMVDEVTAAKMVEEAITALVEAKPEAEPGAAGEVLPASTEPAGKPGSVKKETLTKEYAGTFSNEKGEVNPMLVRLMAENRQIKIDGLVKGGKINPAVAKDLAEQFIGKEGAAVSLALSQGSDGSDFNLMIAAFEKNQPIKAGEKTGAQAGKDDVTLSDASKGGGEKPNPLIADADRRRKEAKERAA